MGQSRGLVGWVVDAQSDFMNPAGRLYVRDLQDRNDAGAVRIVSELVGALEWMEAECELIVFTGDWHGIEDEEIDETHPDPAQGTYPPHCMGRSEDASERAGAEIIAEIRPRDPLVLPLDADGDAAREIAARAVGERRPVFIRKNRFDVFTGNPATPSFLEGLETALGARPRFVVVGVARDVCVTQAVDGLLARGYPVTAVSDATWGLGLEPEEVTLGRWAEKGRVVTLDQLRST